MNYDTFSAEQKYALLDMVTLAMYADGHLAGAEDDRVLRLLGALGFTSDYERSREYDAAISRVSRHSKTAESAREYALDQAQLFTTRDQRRLVALALDEIVTSDRHVADSENTFLSLIRGVLEK